MIGPHRIEGYAIISADGMIADANGVMPDAIRNDADQRFLQTALDHAVAIVHGRHSHEGGPRAARRNRLILTRQIDSLAPDPTHPHSLLWNPAGATFGAAIDALGVGTGVLAIIGGTEVFDFFLPIYDAFHLSCATHARIPGGRPLFAAIASRSTPQEVLTRHGLRPGPPRTLDAAAGVTLTTWEH